MVQRLTPYLPGEQPKIAGLVKLNTNENPYPPSPQAFAAIGAVTAGDLRLYPDPESTELCAAIGRAWAVPPGHVFVGNGSDEVLAFVFQGLLNSAKGPLVFPDVTYSFYPSYCRLYDITAELLPLEKDFCLDLTKVPAHAGAVVFPNPNAPTGHALSRQQIESLVKSRPELMVVVDEAYVDFGAESCVPLTLKYENLLVTQSFSKSRALAGLRVGFAIGQPALLDALNRIKNSFNSYPIDRLAAAGATAAIADHEWFESNRSKVIASRERMSSGLKALGFEVVPSMANFVFTRHPQHDGAVLTQRLREHNILVRHFAKPRIDQHLRISVGTDLQVDTLLNTLKALLKD